MVRTKFDQSARQLYRRILRLHRDLPDPVMRVLGMCTCARNSRIHCGPPNMQTSPATPEQMRMFTRQWGQYADQIEAGQVGMGISRQQKQTLSPEQQLKLRELREAIRGGAFHAVPGGLGGGAGKEGG